jgi:hypothetical protein
MNNPQVAKPVGVADPSLGQAMNIQPPVPVPATPAPQRRLSAPARTRKPKSKLPAKRIKPKRDRHVVTKPKKRGRPTTKPEGERSPNRPLELRRQLDMVVELAKTLPKAELGFTIELIERLRVVSKATRKRVLAAIVQMFGDSI